jgi:hypothetical protein
MSFQPTDKKIVIEPLTSSVYTSKFTTIAVVMHGFEAVAGQLKVNGKSTKAKSTNIDLYNSIKPNDPLWFNSRKMEQNILVIDDVKPGSKTEISW